MPHGSDGFGYSRPVLSQRTPRPESRALALVFAIVVVGGYVLPSCARTPLDQPVDVTGSAGTRAPTTGRAGSGGAGGHGGGGAGGGGIGGNGMAGHGGAGAGGTMGVAGTGGFAECIDGTSRCASANGIQLCQGSKWGPVSSCSMACISGICAECMPGAKECSGPESFRVCTSAGLWPDPVQCLPGTPCVAGACTGPTVDGGVPDGGGTDGGACVESTAECVGTTQVRLCLSGMWGAPFTCEHGCIGGVCAECTPGEVRCSGAQTCTMAGVWLGTPCAN